MDPAQIYRGSSRRISSSSCHCLTTPRSHTTALQLVLGPSWALRGWEQRGWPQAEMALRHLPPVLGLAFKNEGGGGGKILRLWMLPGQVPVGRRHGPAPALTSGLPPDVSAVLPLLPMRLSFPICKMKELTRTQDSQLEGLVILSLLEPGSDPKVEAPLPTAVLSRRTLHPPTGRGGFSAAKEAPLPSRRVTPVLR